MKSRRSSACCGACSATRRVDHVQTDCLAQPPADALAERLRHTADDIKRQGLAGFLVPRAEGRSMLACTFVHNKFSYRAPEGSALLRCFFVTLVYVSLWDL